MVNRRQDEWHSSKIDLKQAALHARKQQIGIILFANALCVKRGGINGMESEKRLYP